MTALTRKMLASRALRISVSEACTQVHPPERRRGGGRIRHGGGAVSCACFRDHGNSDGVLRRPGAGNGGRGFRAPDHDRPGAEAGLRPVASSRPKSASGSSACSIAPAACKVDVRTYTSFASRRHCPSRSMPNGNLIENFTYKPGGPGDIVVVRLLYQWPVYVPLLGINLADMAGSKRLMVATVGVPQRALSMRRVMLPSAIMRFIAPVGCCVLPATSAAYPRWSSP